MSLKSGIFNSTAVETTSDGLVRGNKAVDASFLAKMFSTFFSTGVVRGTDASAFLSRSAGDGALSVVTYPGACIINGYFGYDTQAEVRTFAPSDSRRLAVRILRLDLTDGSISVLWKDCMRISGTLISASDQQVLPARSDAVYDLITCIVDIPAGTTVLTDAMVTDTRGDAAYCGIAAIAV